MAGHSQTMGAQRDDPDSGAIRAGVLIAVVVCIVLNGLEFSLGRAPADIVLSDGVPDAGYEFVKRLLENDVVIFKSGSRLADSAGKPGQEDPLIAFTNMTCISRNDSRGNVNVLVPDLDPAAKMIYPTFMSVAARAPHPNATKVFIAYLMGNLDVAPDTVIEKPCLEGASIDLLQGLALSSIPGNSGRPLAPRSVGKPPRSARLPD